MFTLNFDIIKNDDIVPSLFLIIHTLKTKQNITPLLGDMNSELQNMCPFS